MSTPEPPTTQTPPPGQPGRPRRSWGSRLRSRGVIIGAAIVALVVVGGAAAALLIPDRDRDRWGPGFDRSGWVGAHDGRGDGPWAGGPGGRWDDHDDDERGGPGGFDFGDGPVLAGSVVSIGNGTLVVAVDGGAQRTLRTDGDTRVRGAGNSALGDLQTGERVVVQVTGTGDAATARTVWSPQARVAGTVTALAADRATVTSIDGLAVAVDVTALSQKPVVGDVVVLTGVAADAGTIRADGIRVLPRAS